VSQLFATCEVVEFYGILFLLYHPLRY